MQVVLLVNLNLRAGLCNGSQGIIVDFEPYDEYKLPRRPPNGTPGSGLVGEHASLKENHIREFVRKQKPSGPSWPRVYFFNLPTTDRKTGKYTRTIYPEYFVTEVGEANNNDHALVCRTQIPLVAAWALTTHKAQGMTLDRVIVDLARAFEEGQVYVALSRATSLQGLKIEGDPRQLSVLLSRPGGHPEVRE